MEPLRGGLDDAGEHQEPRHDKGDVRDADQFWLRQTCGQVARAGGFRRVRSTSLPLGPNYDSLLSAGRLSGLGDLVIAATAEFDQTEAVPEGIRDADDLAPGSAADLGFNRRACALSARQSGFEIPDHHVKMHRGQMPFVGPSAFAGAERPVERFQEVETYGPTA